VHGPRWTGARAPARNARVCVRPRINALVASASQPASQPASQSARRTSHPAVASMASSLTPPRHLQLSHPVHVSPFRRPWLRTWEREPARPGRSLARDVRLCRRCRAVLPLVDFPPCARVKSEPTTVLRRPVVARARADGRFRRRAADRGAPGADQAAGGRGAVRGQARGGRAGAEPGRRRRAARQQPRGCGDVAGADQADADGLNVQDAGGGEGQVEGPDRHAAQGQEGAHGRDGGAARASRRAGALEQHRVLREPW
jgi:hypothetical protein